MERLLRVPAELFLHVSPLGNLIKVAPYPFPHLLVSLSGTASYSMDLWSIDNVLSEVGRKTVSHSLLFR